MYTWTTTFCNQLRVHFETMLVKVCYIEQSRLIDQNQSVGQSLPYVQTYLSVSTFLQCAIHSTFKKCFSLEYQLTSIQACSSIPTITHTSFISVIKRKKLQVDHSDWYNLIDLLHLCLHTLYSHTGDDTSCAHWELGWRTGKRTTVGSEGHKLPERRLIYWKEDDLI